MKLELYRKAIAVCLTGLVGFLAQFVPGLAEHVGSETIALFTAVLATAAAYLTENRAEGWNVNDLAGALIDAASNIEPPDDDTIPAAAPTVTGTVISIAQAIAEAEAGGNHG